MNPQEMLDYVFDSLDEPRRSEVEDMIAADPQLATTVEQLQTSLDLLLDDGDSIIPPPDLAARTLTHVALYRSKRSILEYVPKSVPFRWADVAVAAGIFLAGLITLLPAMHRSRMQYAEEICTDNLRRLGQSLATYSTIHGYYPYPPADSPIPYAGLYKVMLNDGGHLDDQATLDCPSNGRRKGMPLPDYKSLCALQSKDPHEFRLVINGDYAYHLGFRQPEMTGTPGPIPARLTARVPLMSDTPPHDEFGHIHQGNSPNHGGLGQNVLFNDGHVGWYATRMLGPLDRDMFLNNLDRPEPGLTPRDAVLAPGVVPFYDGNGH